MASERARVEAGGGQILPDGRVRAPLQEAYPPPCPVTRAVGGFNKKFLLSTLLPTITDNVPSTAKVRRGRDCTVLLTGGFKCLSLERIEEMVASGREAGRDPGDIGGSVCQEEVEEREDGISGNLAIIIAHPF